MNFKLWLHGLLTAVVSAFASAASGAIVMPTIFTFDKHGFGLMAKLAAVPAMLAGFAYLKQQPVPSLTVTVTPEATVVSQKAPQ